MPNGERGEKREKEQKGEGNIETGKRKRTKENGEEIYSRLSL